MSIIISILVVAAVIAARLLWIITCTPKTCYRCGNAVHEKDAKTCVECGGEL